MGFRFIIIFCCKLILAGSLGTLFGKSKSELGHKENIDYLPITQIQKNAPKIVQKTEDSTGIPFSHDKNYTKYAKISSHLKPRKAYNSNSGQELVTKQICLDKIEEVCEECDDASVEHTPLLQQDESELSDGIDKHEYRKCDTKEILFRFVDSFDDLKDIWIAENSLPKRINNDDAKSSVSYVKLTNDNGILKAGSDTLENRRLLDHKKKAPLLSILTEHDKHNENAYKNLYVKLSKHLNSEIIGMFEKKKLRNEDKFFILDWVLFKIDLCKYIAFIYQKMDAARMSQKIVREKIYKPLPKFGRDANKQYLSSDNIPENQYNKDMWNQFYNNFCKFIDQKFAEKKVYSAYYSTNTSIYEKWKLLLIDFKKHVSNQLQNLNKEVDIKWKAAERQNNEDVAEVIGIKSDVFRSVEELETLNDCILHVQNDRKDGKTSTKIINDLKEKKESLQVKIRLSITDMISDPPFYVYLTEKKTSALLPQSVNPETDTDIPEMDPELDAALEEAFALLDAGMLDDPRPSNNTDSQEDSSQPKESVTPKSSEYDLGQSAEQEKVNRKPKNFVCDCKGSGTNILQESHNPVPLKNDSRRSDATAQPLLEMYPTFGNTTNKYEFDPSLDKQGHRNPDPLHKVRCIDNNHVVQKLENNQKQISETETYEHGNKQPNSQENLVQEKIPSLSSSNIEKGTLFKDDVNAQIDADNCNFLNFEVSDEKLTDHVYEKLEILKNDCLGIEKSDFDAGKGIEQLVFITMLQDDVAQTSQKSKDALFKKLLSLFYDKQTAKNESVALQNIKSPSQIDFVIDEQTTAKRSKGLFSSLCYLINQRLLRWKKLTVQHKGKDVPLTKDFAPDKNHSTKKPSFRRSEILQSCLEKSFETFKASQKKFIVEHNTNSISFRDASMCQSRSKDRSQDKRSTKKCNSAKGREMNADVNTNDLFYKTKTCMKKHKDKHQIEEPRKLQIIENCIDNVFYYKRLSCLIEAISSEFVGNDQLISFIFEQSPEQLELNTYSEKCASVHKAISKLRLNINFSVSVCEVVDNSKIILHEYRYAKQSKWCFLKLFYPCASTQSFYETTEVNFKITDYHFFARKNIIMDVVGDKWSPIDTELFKKCMHLSYGVLLSCMKSVNLLSSPSDLSIDRCSSIISNRRSSLSFISLSERLKKKSYTSKSPKNLTKCMWNLPLDFTHCKRLDLDEKERRIKRRGLFALDRTELAIFSEGFKLFEKEQGLIEKPHGLQNLAYTDFIQTQNREKDVQLCYVISDAYTNIFEIYKKIEHQVADNKLYIVVRYFFIYVNDKTRTLCYEHVLNPIDKSEQLQNNIKLDNLMYNIKYYLRNSDDNKILNLNSQYKLFLLNDFPNESDYYNFTIENAKLMPFIEIKSINNYFKRLSYNVKYLDYDPNDVYFAEKIYSFQKLNLNDESTNIYSFSNFFELFEAVNIMNFSEYNEILMQKKVLQFVIVLLSDNVSSYIVIIDIMSNNYVHYVDLIHNLEVDFLKRFKTKVPIDYLHVADHLHATLSLNPQLCESFLKALCCYGMYFLSSSLDPYYKQIKSYAINFTSRLEGSSKVFSKYESDTFWNDYNIEHNLDTYTRQSIINFIQKYKAGYEIYRDEVLRVCLDRSEPNYNVTILAGNGNTGISQCITLKKHIKNLFTYVYY